MHEIPVLAQVAADFAKTPVIYEWPDGEDPKLARPRKGARKPYDPLRMDLDGVHRDRLVGAVKKGMNERLFEYAEARVDGIHQVTVWRGSKPNEQQTHSDERLDVALIGALALVAGVH